MIQLFALTPSMSAGHGELLTRIRDRVEERCGGSGCDDDGGGGSGEHAADAHTGMLTGIWSVFVFDCNSQSTRLVKRLELFSHSLLDCLSLPRKEESADPSPPFTCTCRRLALCGNSRARSQ